MQINQFGASDLRVLHRRQSASQGVSKTVAWLGQKAINDRGIYRLP